MTTRLTKRFIEQLSATWKFCLSFRKRDWELNDYPVFVREQKFSPEYSAPRFNHHRYLASVVNWGVAGTGDTRQEARADLSKTIESVRIARREHGRHLPRPGTREPIEFASQERVMAHPELAEDFVRRVLGLDWAWISDESSLWDFHPNETNELLCNKIMEVYGVDVSDIESAKLSEILDRLAVARSN
jgi:hypothetical protein